MIEQQRPYSGSKRTSSRPPYASPEQWQKLSAAQRKKETEIYKKLLEDEEKKREEEKKAKGEPAPQTPFMPEQPSDDFDVWIRNDQAAKEFRKPNSGGPRWENVRRRVSENADTGEIIQDLWCQDFDTTEITAPIPGGPVNLRFSTM